MTMLSLWLAAVVGVAVDQTPPDVRRDDRREQCAHWAGEEPYDRVRADEITTAMRGLGCADIDVEEADPEDAGAAFAPSGDPEFGDATAALRDLMARDDPAPRGPQHFCAIGYRLASGPQAWVHWREANRLILWWGAAPQGQPDDSLVMTNRRLDLSTDVVATEAEIGGSTYLVTRAWVDALLADCASQGDPYVIPAP